MKKTLSILMVLVLVLSVFTGCSKKSEAPAATAAPEVKAEVKAEKPAPKAPALKVGMVTDSGTIDDRSFNQGTYEGVKNAADELGLECTYLRPNGTTTAEYVTAIADLYDSGYRFVACPGFLFDEAVTQASEMFPDLNLVIIDSAPKAGNNVVSVLFKEEESGFLGGVAIALQLKEGSVGFVGGIEIPPVQKYNWGFQQGIAYANANYGTNIVIKPENFVYSGSFSDVALGQQLATTMYSSGVDCIFACAGGVGVGVINECKNRVLAGEDVWVLGVDVDQYAQGDLGNGKSCIITSAMKYIDRAAGNLVKAAANGTFPGGTLQVLGAAENGVGIPADNPNLDDAVEAEVAKVYAKVASGEIVVQDNPEGLIK